jgi:hypothetical protein
MKSQRLSAIGCYDDLLAVARKFRKRFALLGQLAAYHQGRVPAPVCKYKFVSIPRQLTFS